MDLKSIILPLQAAIKAGEKIKKIYESADFSISYKKDDSPLTTADLAANEIINSFLMETDFPVLSEENKEIAFNERKEWKTYWLVDPLDGTKEFINKSDEFTVNIALISDGVPVFGVIYTPVFRKLYFGAEGLGSYSLDVANDQIIDEHLLEKSSILSYPAEENPKHLKVVASRSHLSEETMEYVESLKSKDTEIEFVSKGSSLKLCLVAEGKADIYPRLGPTMEWDVAAGHAILKYSGKTLIDFHSKKELKYNKENLLNPWFIAK